MNKAIGLALLGVGIALIIFGLNASDSVGSEISRFFAGTPTNKSMWLLVGSAAATAVCTFNTFRHFGKV